MEESLRGSQLALGRRPPEGEAEHRDDALAVIVQVGVLGDPVAETGREMHDLDVVHHQQRLRGHVRLVALALGGDGGGQVQCVEHGIRLISDDLNVDAAPVRPAGYRLRFGCVNRFEIAGGGQHRVANRFGLQPPQVSVRQEVVLRIHLPGRG